MIEKELIKRGVFCTIQREIPLITDKRNKRYIDLSLNTDALNPLVGIDYLQENGFALCYVYDRKLFGRIAMIPVSHIEENGDVVNVGEKDKVVLNEYVRQLERESLNADPLEFTGEPSPRLQACINNLLNRNFRERYGIKREGDLA